MRNGGTLDEIKHHKDDWILTTNEISFGLLSHSEATSFISALSQLQSSMGGKFSTGDQCFEMNMVFSRRDSS